MDGDLIHIAGPKGLGDAIYIRAIALHLIGQGKRVAVSTHWPDVFLGVPVSIVPLNGNEMQVGFSLRHPGGGSYPDTAGLSQFDIWCRRAGIAEPVKLELRWPVQNRNLVRLIRRKAAGRKILVYQPRKKDNPLSPRRNPFYAWVRERSDCYRVRVGHPQFVEGAVSDCEMDLVGQTGVTDIFDVATVADLFFGDLCYLGIVADALEKRSVCMLSSEAVAAPGWCHLSAHRLFRNTHLAELIYD